MPDLSCLTSNRYAYDMRSVSSPMSMRLAKCISKGISLLFGLTAWCLASSSLAEQGFLVISVADVNGRALPGVTMTLQGDSATSAPSTIEGKIRIKLPAAERPGNWVSLRLLNDPKQRSHWVFVSPWDGRAIVPRFENESGNFVATVIAQQGDRAFLTDQRAVQAIVSAILDRIDASAESSAKNNRAKILEETATRYGFDVGQVDKAIKSWSQKPSTPYAQGLAQMYRENYPAAADSFREAVQALEKKIEQDHRSLSEASYFLGYSLFRQSDYEQATKYFEKAIANNYGNSIASYYLGLTRLRVGDSEGALEHLKSVASASTSQFTLRIYSLATIGLLEKQRTNYLQSAQAYLTALALAENESNRSAPVIGTLLTNMAELYSAQAQYNEAERYYRRALEVWKSQGKGSEFRQAITLSGLSVVLRISGRNEEAERLERDVTSLVRATVTKDDGRSDISRISKQLSDRRGNERGAAIPNAIAAISDELPKLLQRMDLDLSQAIEHMASAEQRRTEEFTRGSAGSGGGIEYIDMPPSNNYSILPYARPMLDNNYDTIFALYSQVVTEIERLPAMQAFRLVPLICDMARIKYLRRDMESAYQLFDKCKTLADNVASMNPGVSALAYGRFADFYTDVSSLKFGGYRRQSLVFPPIRNMNSKAEAFAEAARLYEMEISLLEKSSVASEIEITRKILKLGKRYSDNEDFRQAIKYGERAKARVSAGDALLDQIAHDLGGWYAEAGEFHEAINTYEALRNRTKTRDAEFLSTLGALAEWYSKVGNQNSAELALVEKLNVSLLAKNENHREFAVREARSDLSEFYTKRGQLEKAISALEPLVNDLRNGGWLRRFPNYLDNLGSLYVATGNSAAAEAAYKYLSEESQYDRDSYTIKYAECLVRNNKLAEAKKIVAKLTLDDVTSEAIGARFEAIRRTNDRQ